MFNCFDEFLSVLHLLLVSLSYLRMLHKKFFPFIIILHCHNLLCQLSVIITLFPKLIKFEPEIPKSVIEHCSTVWISEGLGLTIFYILTNQREIVF